ncbi:MAG: hypothetical protein ACRDTT_33240, partial [Pseudonocardiaceae bacterium]
MTNANVSGSRISEKSRFRSWPVELPRVFPRLDPPLPTPGQYDVELVLQSEAPAEQLLETVAA